MRFGICISILKRQIKIHNYFSSFKEMLFKNRIIRREKSYPNGRRTRCARRKVIALSIYNALMYTDGKRMYM